MDEECDEYASVDENTDGDVLWDRKRVCDCYWDLEGDIEDDNPYYLLKYLENFLFAR